MIAVYFSGAQIPYQPVADRFLQFFNRQQADSIFLMYAPVIQKKLSLEKNSSVMNGLYVQFGELRSLSLVKKDSAYAQFKANFKDQALTLVLALNKEGFIEGLRFIPLEPEQKKGQEIKSNIFLPTPKGNIYGTIKIPSNANKQIPVVLIIAGSGPTDRNGNQAPSLNTNTYQMIADSLLKAGIASLRYDKRGVGESAGALVSESNIVFEDYIHDAVGFVKLLKGDRRFSKVIVLGHSEGSLIGMVAAAQVQVDGFISVAGAGERIDKIIEKQLNAQSPALAEKAKILLDSLKKGKTVADPGGDLQALFRPSIQPYLISWLKFNPAEEIKKLNMPILLIQGNTDLQISMQDVQLLKLAVPTARLVIIDQMNHVLKQSETERSKNLATYNQPDLPIKTELVQAIGGFVHWLVLK